MPKKLDIKVVAFQDWPAADRAAWDEARRPRRRLDGNDGLTRYPQSRLTITTAAYGRWLGFLRVYLCHGMPESGLDHLDQTTLQAFLDRMYGQVSSCTVRGYVTDLYFAVRAVAPERPTGELRNAYRLVWRAASAERDKSQLIVPARELYTLGFKLMDRAPEQSSTLGRARQYRDGLAIAMLIAAPVRMRNFASIELGRALSR